MRYIKKFEEETKLHDLKTIDPKYKRNEKGEKVFKYNENDYVIFKPLNKIFCIRYNNPTSDNQDYFIYDPFNEKDWRNRGWCAEEELRKPTKKEIKDVEHLIIARSFNL